jgi:hypothetical protein
MTLTHSQNLSLLNWTPDALVHISYNIRDKNKNFRQKVGIDQKFI